MARKYLSKYKGGRRGLENIFKRDKKLRWGLSRKQRHFALGTLGKFQGGRGVTVRDGPGATSELAKASRQWSKNTKDPISKADAKMIKKRLQLYGRELPQDAKHPKTSRRFFDYHTEEHDKNSPHSSSGDRYRGDVDDRPSMSYRDPLHSLDYESDTDNIDDPRHSDNTGDRRISDDDMRDHDDFDPGRLDAPDR